MKEIVDIGSRRELFVDRFLVESLEGVAFKLHTPQLAPPAAGGSPCGAYMTVLKDGERYRAYYRQVDPQYAGDHYDGHPGEITCLAESGDGIDWRFPELGLFEVNGVRSNNAVLRQAPYSHNFSPFIDTNPAAAPNGRFKALAGTHGGHGRNSSNGLHAFVSADGMHWDLLQDGPVITQEEFAFDSQNVSFWSEAESCYVCFFRTWDTPHGRLRTISRTTSQDFLHWTAPVAMAPNLPGEHLYTSQTHPCFRAPHIYIALPTRFRPDRGDSTDILFMTTRAGTNHYERLFTEAFIQPGLDPRRWGNRSNYAACGVIPTGPAEMSIYHGPAGRRYTLRTDGFISIHADHDGGTLTTKPFTFTGSELSLNVATSAAGSVRVELRDEAGRPVPGRSRAEADEIVGDSISQRVTWRGDGHVAAWAGRPVQLHIEMREADLYSLAFVPPFYGPASTSLTAYFETLAAAAGEAPCGSGDLECVYHDKLVHALSPSVKQARAAVRGQSPYEERLAPIVAGYEVACRALEIIDRYPELTPQEMAHALDEVEQAVLRFDPDDVFGRGPALYPPITRRWQTFRKRLTEQARVLASMFIEPRIVGKLDKHWRFQTDPSDKGLDAGWMNDDCEADTWPLINADCWWQEQGYPDYHGTAWYRRSFDAPAIGPDRRLILYFGAVDGDSTVFLNGRKLGDHLLEPDGAGWNQPFHFDITGYVANGNRALIAVRVCKKVCYSGIFRGVKLLETRGVKNRKETQ